MKKNKLTQLDRIERKLTAILGHECSYVSCDLCQWALTPEEFKMIKPMDEVTVSNGDLTTVEDKK